MKAWLGKDQKRRVAIVAGVRTPFAKAGTKMKDTSAVHLGVTVAREAMAYGRPVVATGVGGLLDAIEDGVTGLLVPRGDPAALRAALERLLTDEVLRASLGRVARERARTTLSWNAATEATVSTYRDAVGS